MAAVLTLQDIKQRIAGDNHSRHYLVTLTGAYPAGGFSINAAEYPDATAVFKAIRRVIFSGGCMSDNGVFFRASPEDFDNDDSDDPLFLLKLYEIPTGGGVPVEVTTGNTVTETIYIIIDGITFDGVDGEPW